VECLVSDNTGINIFSLMLFTMMTHTHTHTLIYVTSFSIPWL